MEKDENKEEYNKEIVKAVEKELNKTANKKSRPSDGSSGLDENEEDEIEEVGSSDKRFRASNQLGGHLSRKAIEEMVRKQSRADREAVLMTSADRNKLKSSLRSAQNRSGADQQKKERAKESKVEKINKDIENGYKNFEKRVNKVRNIKAKDFKSALKKRLSRKRNRRELDAVSATVIIFAVSISILADLIDIVLTLLAVTTAIAPITSFLTSIIVGALWWSIGAGDASNKLKKVSKRLGVTGVIEAVPGVNSLPTFTIMSFINVLDYFGYLEKIIDNISKRVDTVVKRTPSGY